jgi:hypothetical protein
MQSSFCSLPQSKRPARGEIHEIGIRNFLVCQLAYLVFSRIFLVAREIGESLGSYLEYPDKSVGKQG